jgi:hypothetical protein
MQPSNARDDDVIMDMMSCEGDDDVIMNMMSCEGWRGWVSDVTHRVVMGDRLAVVGAGVPGCP